MQIRKMLLVAVATTGVIAGGAFAQTAKNHSAAANGADKKGSAEAAKPEMTAQDLKARLDKGETIIIIDARHDLAGQIIKGAIHVPSDKLEDWAKNTDKSAVIVTYCTCPHDEAAEAEVQSLLKMGFKNSFSLKGGMDAARAAGIEVVTPVDK